MISKLFRLLGMRNYPEPSSDVSGDTDDDSNAPDSGLPEERKRQNSFKFSIPNSNGWRESICAGNE